MSYGCFVTAGGLRIAAAMFVAFLSGGAASARAPQDTLPEEADPHRPACADARCETVKPFLKAHYCGESPTGEGPEDGCDIRQAKGSLTDVTVIADYNCVWHGDEGRAVCRQRGQGPPRVRAAINRKLRILGLPAGASGRTYFTVWRSKHSGWSVAEGSHSRVSGSTVTLCQVILAIDPKGQVFIVREVPLQRTDVDVPTVTTWSPLDFIDADGDGQPELVLLGEEYENHWLEVYSFESSAPRMIFSGLGYYL